MLFDEFSEETTDLFYTLHILTKNAIVFQENLNIFLDNFYLIIDEARDQSKLKFYCPFIDANSLSYDSLIISLRDAAGHYCLSRRTWDEYVKRPMQLSHLVREKFRELSNNTGELGELLLFSFLETDLKAPKLLTKMELKTNPNMYFNGADGVHYLKLENNNYQLIFGAKKDPHPMGCRQKKEMTLNRHSLQARSRVISLNS